MMARYLIQWEQGRPGDHELHDTIETFDGPHPFADLATAIAYADEISGPTIAAGSRKILDPDTENVIASETLGPNFSTYAWTVEDE